MTSTAQASLSQAGGRLHFHLTLNLRPMCTLAPECLQPSFPDEPLPTGGRMCFLACLLGSQSLRWGIANLLAT